MAEVYKIIAVNPGSTTTKFGYFENENNVFTANIAHSRDELAGFAEVQDQLDYRFGLIEKECLSRGVDLGSVDIFVGRGGGLLSVEGGVYDINDRMVYDASVSACGVPHPANLSVQICRKFIEKYGGCGYTVNPPDVDEYQDASRITGLKGIYRRSSIHALNQKEIAYRYCKDNGLEYSKANLVIAHLGGGISITAHKSGRMIDSNDILMGDGPMTPTRAGTMFTTTIVNMCFSGEYTKDEIVRRLTKQGGLLDHLGTDDAREVEAMIKDGSKYAETVYDAMIYQIAKYIGSMAVSLGGKVDQIILTGGMSHSKYLTDAVKEQTEWISGVTVMPGEFELEALAAGAYRAKTGEEQTKTYTGEPVFKGFEF